MEHAARRQLLQAEYRSYVEIINERGLTFSGPISDDEIAKLPDADLAIFVRTARTIARTPAQ